MMIFRSDVPSLTQAARPLVALDRDGTLIEWVPHLHKATDIRLLPGATNAVERLASAGCVVVIVTNQSVISRGLLSASGLESISMYLHGRFRLDASGVTATYACPHLEEDCCECRKPSPKMLERACADWDADQSQVWVVGDNTSDMLMAQRANARGIRVMTGVQVADLAGARYQVVRNIGEAASLILRELGRQ